MKRISNCRRSVIALVSLGLLFSLGIHNGSEVAPHIVAVVVAVCGANSMQAILEKK